MKTITTLLTAVILMTGSQVFAGTVEVHTAKRNDRFVFTIDKSMRGGEVTVVYTNGDVVTTQKLTRRKMIIDFKQVKGGNYTIVVSKGGQEERFQFEKR